MGLKCPKVYFQIDSIMKNLFLFNKSVVLGIWLLLSIFAQLEAQMTIKDFNGLKKELQNRIDSNSSKPGKIHENLILIKSNFKEIYKDTLERNETIRILNQSLSVIKKEGKDRSIVEKIKESINKSIFLSSNNETKNNELINIPPSKTESDSIKTLQEQIIKLEEQSATKYSMIWWIVPSCLATLFLGLSIYFFIENNKNSKDVKRIRGERNNLKSENTNLHNSLTEIKRNDNSNQQQQSENLILIAELRKELKEALKPKSNDIRDNNKQAEATPPTKVYYFSTPQPDGTFNDSNKSDLFIATSSMYKFTILSSNKAHFEFINDESTLRDALNYPDSYLLPVCRAENTRNIKATKITTIGKGGIAELNDGRWIVTEKAVIRYD